MRKINTIVFDFDNTLWDFYNGYHAIIDELIYEFKKVTNASRDEIVAGFQAVNKKYNVFEHPMMISEHPLLIEKFNGDVPHAILKELHGCYIRGEHRHITPYMSAIETLSELKSMGYRLICYSESSAHVLSRRIGIAGMTPFFSDVFSGIGAFSQEFLEEGEGSVVIRDFDSLHASKGHHEINRRTPKCQPEVFKHVLEHIGISLENVAMVGDNAVRDVYMAQSQGAKGILAKYGQCSYRDDCLVLATVPSLHPAGEKFEVSPDGVLHDSIEELIDVLNMDTEQVVAA